LVRITADVDVNGNLRAFEIRNQGHPDAFVVGVLGYAFPFYGVRIGAQAVLAHFKNAEFSKNASEALRGIVAASEELASRVGR
jgi:hypothetical protein